MKVLKILGIGVAVYVVIVVGFESLIGYFQPANASTLVITTFDDDGVPHDRVVSRLEQDGRIYVATNHWPRSWYHRALEDPNVHVAFDGQASDYRAVPVTAAEHARLTREKPLGIVFRVLTGFPPRHFLRLDPR